MNLLQREKDLVNVLTTVWRSRCTGKSLRNLSVDHRKARACNKLVGARLSGVIMGECWKARAHNKLAGASWYDFLMTDHRTARIRNKSVGASSFGVAMDLGLKDTWLIGTFLHGGRMVLHGGGMLHQWWCSFQRKKYMNCTCLFMGVGNKNNMMKERVDELLLCVRWILGWRPMMLDSSDSIGVCPDVGWIVLESPIGECPAVFIQRQLIVIDRWIECLELIQMEEAFWLRVFSKDSVEIDENLSLAEIASYCRLSEKLLSSVVWCLLYWRVLVGSPGGKMLGDRMILGDRMMHQMVAKGGLWTDERAISRDCIVLNASDQVEDAEQSIDESLEIEEKAWRLYLAICLWHLEAEMQNICELVHEAEICWRWFWFVVNHRKLDVLSFTTDEIEWTIDKSQLGRQRKKNASVDESQFRLVPVEETCCSQTLDEDGGNSNTVQCLLVLGLMLNELTGPITCDSVILLVMRKCIRCPLYIRELECRDGMVSVFSVVTVILVGDSVQRKPQETSECDGSSIQRKRLKDQPVSKLENSLLTSMVGKFGHLLSALSELCDLEQWQIEGYESSDLELVNSLLYESSDLELVNSLFSVNRAFDRVYESITIAIEQAKGPWSWHCLPWLRGSNANNLDWWTGAMTLAMSMIRKLKAIDWRCYVIYKDASKYCLSWSYDTIGTRGLNSILDIVMFVYRCAGRWNRNQVHWMMIQMSTRDFEIFWRWFWFIWNRQVCCWRDAVYQGLVALDKAGVPGILEGSILNAILELLWVLLLRLDVKEDPLQEADLSSQQSHTFDVEDRKPMEASLLTTLEIVQLASLSWLKTVSLSWWEILVGPCAGRVLLRSHYWCMFQRKKMTEASIVAGCGGNKHNNHGWQCNGSMEALVEDLRPLGIDDSVWWKPVLDSDSVESASKVAFDYDVLVLESEIDFAIDNMFGCLVLDIDECWTSEVKEDQVLVLENDGADLELRRTCIERLLEHWWLNLLDMSLAFDRHENLLSGLSLTLFGLCDDNLCWSRFVESLFGNWIECFDMSMTFDCHWNLVPLLSEIWHGWFNTSLMSDCRESLFGSHVARSSGLDDVKRDSELVEVLVPFCKNWVAAEMLQLIGAMDTLADRLKVVTMVQREKRKLGLILVNMVKREQCRELPNNEKLELSNGVNIWHEKCVQILDLDEQGVERKRDGLGWPCCDTVYCVMEDSLDVRLVNTDSKMADSLTRALTTESFIEFKLLLSS